MKFVAVFAVLLVFVNLSEQIPKLINCPADFTLTESMRNRCTRMQCVGPGKVREVGCGVSQCANGEYIGYKQQDKSKVYPDCCGGPICAD